MNKHASDPATVRASLQKSVAAALERKRRLGQYAMIWRDGRPVRVEPEELDRMADYESAAPVPSHGVQEPGPEHGGHGGRRT